MINKEKVAVFNTQDVYQYTLKNKNGMQVSVLNYGGVITKIIFKDKYGNEDNRILAYKDINLYEENPMFLGAIIGRIAGRISNGKYILDNKIHQLELNEVDRNLHGGTKGYHHRFWNVKTFDDIDKSIIQLTLKDNEYDGFVGNLDVSVEYILSNDNLFTIHYLVKTDKKTICNMTNHTYFNLLGSKNNNTIEKHYLKINSDEVAKVDAKTLPTWEFLQVEDDKVFNFKEFREIGLYTMSAHEQQRIVNNGYDHAFKLNKVEDSNQDISLKEKTTGIQLDVTTTEDAVVIYTCNKVDTPYELENHKLQRYIGVTIETQQLPDIVNSNQVNKIIITPEKSYESNTSFKFSLGENM